MAGIEIVHRRAGRLRLFGALALVAALTVVAPATSSADPFDDDSFQSPDMSSVAGGEPSMVLDDDGHPVISYYEFAGQNLKVLVCSNDDCSGAQSPVRVDTGLGVGSGSSSLVLDDDGFPVIAYYGATNGDLNLVHCSNADCSGGQTVNTPDTTDDVGADASLALDTVGVPVIAYQDVTNGNLEVLVCSNADCAGAQTPVTVDSATDVGRDVSMVLDANDFPVIAHYDEAEGDLRVIRCTNVDCSGAQTVQTPATTGDVGQDPAIAIGPNGNPVIAFYNVTERDLELIRCSNADCSGTQVSRTLDQAGSALSTFSAAPSMKLDEDGFPVISYYDAGVASLDLKVLRCETLDCSGDARPIRVDTEGDVGRTSSVAIDELGNPVVAYHDVANQDLKVLHCWDPDGCGGQDMDADGIDHAVDNCPEVANADQADVDEDAIGDPCDADNDNDRVDDVDDNCPGIANVDQANADGDANGDACDPDDDNDGIADGADNCRVDANPDQADADDDGVGDACDEADARIPSSCAGVEGANVIIGTDGDDTLTGTAGVDVIVGLDGNDVIRGLAGDDVICAGPGDDIVSGGKGADTIYGQRGADELSGKSGTDTIRGGSGADTIAGGSGADMLFGGSSGDTISGGSGPDVIAGNSGADTIEGNTGHDTISGGGGRDTIEGNRGRDTIEGNKGRDTLSGGSSADTISGGSAGDTISGGSGNDTLNGNSGSDRCTGGAGVDTFTSCETRLP